MKILLVITGLGVGGAERLLVNIADEFAALGHDVIIVYLHGDAKMLPIDSRVRLVDLELDPNPASLFLALLRFSRLVRSFRPDIINSHLFHANIFSRLSRLVVPMPRLVSSAHNTNEEGQGRMIAYRLTDCLTDISTNVSQEAVYAFERQGALSRGRMVAVQNGIDTTIFSFNRAARLRVRAELGIDDDMPLLLAVGRLWEAKDYPTLLNAFSILLKAQPAANLAIVGDGPLRDALRALASELGVTHRIYFLGIRHDVPAIMSASDVFVLSSAWEGFGLVLAEAMACERPVVATDCGGVREVVGDAGFLVPPCDGKALGLALESVLTLTSDAREELGRQARNRVVKTYSLSAAVERYMAVYRGSGTGAV